jgi:hypothetical protein
MERKSATHLGRVRAPGDRVLNRMHRSDPLKKLMRCHTVEGGLYALVVNGVAADTPRDDSVRWRDPDSRGVADFLPRARADA